MRQRPYRKSSVGLARRYPAPSHPPRKFNTEIPGRPAGNAPATVSTPPVPEIDQADPATEPTAPTDRRELRFCHREGAYWPGLEDEGDGQ